jgi:hypothetical protein
MNKNCSNKKHIDVSAISYCKECKLYLCNKCKNLHSEFYEDHHLFNVDKDINSLFTGLCNKKKHNIELQFYCKDHNELCCAACLCKIQGEEYGQHKDCTVMPISEIKEEKKKKLEENIKCLEDLSLSLNKSINELKSIFVKINENKEELKLKIQNVFTKIRNALNYREDELLLEIDKSYNKNYFSEELIKKGEKMPDKVKESLNIGKEICKKWNDNEINYYIYNCINIENSIKEINIINESITKSNLYIKKQIKFSSNEDEIINKIKTFGNINSGFDIIKNIEDKKMISDWIKLYTNLDFKLLYKVSRDGDRISTFIEKVAGKSPTLIIIQSKSGYTFGGFTSVEWNMKGSYSYKRDENAFIFSIDKRKKYKLKLNSANNAICGDPRHFAFGGGHDLTIWDKCTSNNNSEDYSYNFSYEMLEKYELTGGNNNFYVQDCEVYQVINY